MKISLTLLFLTLFAIGFSKNVSFSHKILPPILELNYSSTNPTCPGLNNGAIYATVTGGNLPLSNFTLTNGSNVVSNATGIFLNLASGNYILSISDIFSITVTRNIVITAPNDLTVSSPTTICSGTPTNLSVSGSTTSYLWTASPPDASLTSLNNTSATPTVSPLATTTYTVTSTSNSPSSNMVTNGDFSLGNTGFTSDYTYVANAGGGGQGIYGVATTAISWFQYFASCNVEHTNGTGKMIIFDGSTSNAGNDKAWGQTIAVQPNQTYTFSYWVQTVALGNPASIANIELKINGVVIGTNLAPSSECSWSLRTYTWNSGTATSAQIALYDKVTASGGNDFAIDDISFTTNVVCNLSKTVLITIANAITPTFIQVGPICSGAMMTALPTFSTNSTPITGTWSTPPIIVPSTTFLFTPDAGQCANTTTMTVTVIPNNTITLSSASGTDSQTKCNNTAITNITYTTVGATGATVTGLPTGVTGIWASNVFTISGTPSALGIFNYTVTLAGGCGTVTATGSITVTPNNTITLSSAIGTDSQTKCIDSAITPITFTTVGATGATVTGLPLGVTGAWANDVFTISGTSSTSGLFNYTVTLTGGCGTITVTGSLTVSPNVTPTFTPVPDICSGYVLLPLPTSSNNSINGNWSPPLDNSATTNYTFTPNLGQCSSIATMTITVTPFPQFSITQGCDGTDFVLSATGIGTVNANYTWFDNLHQNIGTASSITITNQGNYSLELSNNGCSEEKPITVSSISCSVPKGISPNGDGDNDTFDLSILNVNKLQIFNRYGIEVYSKSNYSNEWIGKSNSGEELPDGTYYYIVNFSSGKTNTGWIYINK